MQLELTLPHHFQAGAVLLVLALCDATHLRRPWMEGQFFASLEQTADFRALQQRPWEIAHGAAGGIAAVCATQLKRHFEEEEAIRLLFRVSKEADRRHYGPKRRRATSAVDNT